MNQNKELFNKLGEKEKADKSFRILKLPDIIKSFIVYTIVLVACIALNLYSGYLLGVPDDMSIMGMLTDYWYIYIPNIFAVGFASNIAEGWKS